MSSVYDLARKRLDGADEPLSDERIAELVRAAESRLTVQPPEVAYPLEALGPLHDVANAIVQGQQVRPAMAGQAVLAAAALAAQHTADVETLDGRRPLALFLLTIADSGDGKTGAERTALTPVSEHQRQAHKAYMLELEQYEATPPKEREQPPRPPYRIARDSTAEGIRRSFQEGAPSQGAYTSEAAAVLCGYGMSADHRMKTAGTYNALWDDGEVSVIRSIAGRVQLYDRRLSVHWLIQPAGAKETMHDPALTNLGFWPRFLVAWPEPPAPRRYRPWHANRDASVGAYWARAHELLERDVGDDCGELPVITLSDEARDLAGAYFERMEQAARAASGGLTEVKPFALRATEQACRIAGVLAAFDDTAVVHADLMRCGLRLAAYSVETWRGIFGDREQATAHAHALKLYRWLLKQPGASAKVADLLHVGPKPRSRSLRDSALATLATAGLADREGDAVRAST